jgi:hypothetical protein
VQAQSSAFDLHVLSTPPAFVLSQDQTLRKKHEFNPNKKNNKPPHTPTGMRELAVQNNLLSKEPQNNNTPNTQGTIIYEASNKKIGI